MDGRAFVIITDALLYGGQLVMQIDFDSRGLLIVIIDAGPCHISDHIVCSAVLHHLVSSESPTP